MIPQDSGLEDAGPDTGPGPHDSGPVLVDAAYGAVPPDAGDAGDAGD